MKAIVVYPDEPEPRLSWEEVSAVAIGRREVLVKVRATAVNRADLAQARGHYPPPPGASEILGLEMAGVIAEIGEEVSGWRTGDRVYALLPGGGYAEQVAVPAGMLMRLPDDWSFAQGAAIPEAWLTAFVNLFPEGALAAGESVLIHAGASGVGTAAIQLAREAGATVFVTAGSPEKIALCVALGAAAGFNYKEEDFLAGVRHATEGAGVHLVLDLVGADYLSRNLQVLRPYGRMVQIGSLGGNRAMLDIGVLRGKSLRLIGSRLRPRPLEEKIAMTRAFQERFQPAFLKGPLKPIIDTVFPIQKAQEAHRHVRENHNSGKVVLLVEAS